MAAEELVQLVVDLDLDVDIDDDEIEELDISSSPSFFSQFNVKRVPMTDPMFQRCPQSFFTPLCHTARTKPSKLHEFEQSPTGALK